MPQQREAKILGKSESERRIDQELRKQERLREQQARALAEKGLTFGPTGRQAELLAAMKRLLGK